MIDEICIKCGKRSDPYCIIGNGHVVCRKCFEKLGMKHVDVEEVIPEIKYIWDNFLDVCVRVNRALEGVELDTLGVKKR